MTNLVDLHMHTTASDGVLSPSALVDLAASRGLSVIAITDHDSTEGIAEASSAAQKHPGLQVIPGIEMSAETETDIHILGYFVDVEDTGFQSLLTKLRSARSDRGRQIVAKLAALGMDVSWTRVLELAQGGAVGRPHIAQALKERGYVQNLNEAFERYIGHGGPAYVSRYRLTPAEAIGVLNDLGAVAVMAHPMDVTLPREAIAEMVHNGLGGLECYYPGYSPRTLHTLLKLAREFGLVPTGGTDFHGREDGAEAGPGSVYVPIESARRLIALASRKS
ncbi:MAG: PHP domain-containing protein [Chloroflexota bacterium]|nr:MAG: PHP domain-containing protein [Chloroflexota bacterium]